MPKLPQKIRNRSTALFERRKPFTELIDFTETPDALAKSIDAGEMDALVTFYKLKNGHLGMMNGGFSVESLFKTICELRRTMIAAHQLIDEDDAARGARP